MRFGVREIANVTFRPLAALDIGSQHFAKWQPCLYIDTATASNMEVATTTVYAQGGRGNARLIAWEGEKTATFTVTDALLSPISFAMLSGAGVLDYTGANKIVHLTLDGTITADGSSQPDYITIKAADLAGYTLVTPASVSATDMEKELHMYGMVLDSLGNIVDYLGEDELVQLATANQQGSDIQIHFKQGIEVPAAYNGLTCRIDCYAKTVDANVTTLTVDAENFGGTFYIEAETLFRDEATGQDFPATFIIPKGKISGNFTFNMASSGDPSTFDFTIDCTVGSVRTLPSTEKVLYAIDIIDSISKSTSHIEHATIDVPSQTPSVAGGTGAYTKSE